MAFIQLPTSNPVTPVVLTKAQQLTRDATVLKATGANILRQLKTYADTSLKTVWQNELYTPQEFMNQLGVNAASAMQQHGQLIAYLYSQGVAIDISMVKAYTANQDGTVTVTVE